MLKYIYFLVILKAIMEMPWLWLYTFLHLPSIFLFFLFFLFFEFSYIILIFSLPPPPRSIFPFPTHSTLYLPFPPINSNLCCSQILDCVASRWHVFGFQHPHFQRTLTLVSQQPLIAPLQSGRLHVHLLFPLLRQVWLGLVFIFFLPFFFQLWY